MSKHPPIAAYEMFVGNTEGGEGKLSRLRMNGMTTARLVRPAYSIYGVELPDTFAAVVINRSEAELYDRIMMAEHSRIKRGVKD